MAPSSGSIDSRGLHDLGRGSRTRFGQLRLPIHAICDHQGNEFSDHATIMLLDWRRSRLRAPSSQAIARCGRGATAVLTGSKLTARIVDHDCLPSAAREANGPRSRSQPRRQGAVKLDGTPSRYPPNPGRTMRAPNKEQARACRGSVPTDRLFPLPAASPPEVAAGILDPRTVAVPLAATCRGCAISWARSPIPAVGLAVAAIRHDRSRAWSTRRSPMPISLTAPLLTAVHILISGHAQSRPASFGDG